MKCIPIHHSVWLFEHTQKGMFSDSTNQKTSYTANVSHA